jgi:ATP-dependent 26S proteasome regulatory subunit
MYNLLSVSNGVASNLTKNKKIILSTNLPTKETIDPALLRPGRCFKSIKLEKLTRKESEKFLSVLNSDFDLNKLEDTDYALTDLYRLSKSGVLHRYENSSRKVGF